MLNNCMLNAYSDYWQPISGIYVYWIASKPFGESHILLNHCTQYLSDQWHRYILVQRFWLAIYCMYIHTLVFDIYTPTSSPLLFQLILIDFHYLPKTIFKSVTKVPGQCGEWCSWMHWPMQHDGHHAYSLSLCINCSIYISYNIRNIYVDCKFCLVFSFCFLTSQ